MTDKDKVFSLIENGIETEIVDFKQCFYSDLKNSDIVKDVASFANHLNQEDKYIIFGVTDEDKSVCGVEKKSIIDIDKINEYIAKKIEPLIKLSLGFIEIDEKNVAYLKICKSNTDRPYVVKNNCSKGIEEGDIYIRKNTCNLKALRSDIDAINKSNKEKKIRIFDNYISVRPIKIKNSILENPTYGILEIEIINNTDNSFLICNGYITISNEFAQIKRQIINILPSINLKESPFEAVANKRSKQTAHFDFLSKDCIELGFEDDGYQLHETFVNATFIDTDKNEYTTDKIEVTMNAKGEVLHKIKRLYSEYRSYLIRNKKTFSESIRGFNNERLKELLTNSIFDYSLIHPKYVRNHPDYPEYDIVAGMIEAAVISNNQEAISIITKSLHLKEDFIEFATNM